MVEAQLRQSLTEKDSLLREVHHRVKNNLQVVISLLSLQAEENHDIYLDDHFERAINRLESMSFIYESLYRTGDFSKVDLMEYLITVAQQYYSVSKSRSCKQNLKVH